MTQVPPGVIFMRRVCLQLDGMDDVTIRRDVAYGPPDGRRGMDVYYPPDHTDDISWPAVIIVAGYPGTMEPRPTTLTYKEIGWTVSMCQLIALSGIVAIAYTNRDPVADLHALFEHIHEGARSLRIDAARVGSSRCLGTSRRHSRPSCRTPPERRPARSSATDASSTLTTQPTSQTLRGSSVSPTRSRAGQSRIFDGMFRCSSPGPDATSFQG